MFTWGRPCPTCEELRRQNVYLQALVDRLMVQTWPKVVDEAPEPPDKTEDDPLVAERITFGDG